jgi:hypothetical protein
MDSRESLDSGEGIGLVLPALPVSLEDLAPISGSVLIQPKYSMGLQSQLSRKMASAKRHKVTNIVETHSNEGPKALLSLVPIKGKAEDAEDVWKTESGRYRWLYRRS